MSKKTLQLLNNNLSNVPKEALNSGTQFWDSVKTLKFLGEAEYFKGGDDDTVHLPETLLQMLDPGNYFFYVALNLCRVL